MIFRIKILNLIRRIIRIKSIESKYSQITQGKGLNSLFVRVLPQPSQYPKNSNRFCVRDDINYQLDLSEYMEFVYYFGLKTEEKGALYGLVNKNDVVLDVGVNFGETLLNFAKIVGEKGKVYGFEPVPYIFQKAQQNIKLNSFENIKMLNYALSDQTELLYFDSNPYINNSGGIKMNKQIGKQRVKALTLDQFIETEDIEKIDLIKIDVEGFDFNVLKGAQKTLKRYSPKIFIEVDDQFLKEANSSATELLNFIQNQNYTILNTKKEKIDSEMNLEDCHFDVIAIPN